MKHYTKPTYVTINIDTSIVCSSHHNPHEGWLNKDGEPWKPGDGKPIKPNNAAEYRTNIWED